MLLEKLYILFINILVFELIIVTIVAFSLFVALVVAVRKIDSKKNTSLPGCTEPKKLDFFDLV